MEKRKGSYSNSKHLTNSLPPPHPALKWWHWELPLEIHRLNKKEGEGEFIYIYIERLFYSRLLAKNLADKNLVLPLWQSYVVDIIITSSCIIYGCCASLLCGSQLCGLTVLSRAVLAWSLFRRCSQMSGSFTPWQVASLTPGVSKLFSAFFTKAHIR